MIKTLQIQRNLLDLQRFYHSPLEGESARQERSSQSSRWGRAAGEGAKKAF